MLDARSRLTHPNVHTEMKGDGSDQRRRAGMPRRQWRPWQERRRVPARPSSSVKPSSYLRVRITRRLQIGEKEDRRRGGTAQPW